MPVYMNPYHYNHYYWGYYPVHDQRYYAPPVYYEPFPYYYRDPNAINGKATWTWGGMPTKCELSWSYNHHMTAAVGENSPFQCGQRLKVRNTSFLPMKEVIVTVVDEVKQYPPNRINLHRKAFEALGAPPSIGIIDVEMIPVE